jgi:hypothetical protein
VKRQLINELDQNPDFTLHIPSVNQFWLAPCGTLFGDKASALTYCTILRRVRISPCPLSSYAEDLQWNDKPWDESMVFLTRDSENNGIAHVCKFSDVSTVGSRTHRSDGAIPAFIRAWASKGNSCRVVWMEDYKE